MEAYVQFNHILRSIFAAKVTKFEICYTTCLQNVTDALLIRLVIYQYS